MLFRMGEVERLAGKLLEVKEVVYYALCRPDEFKVWVEAALNASEKEELVLISNELRTAVLFEARISSGRDVNEARSHIFYLDLMIKSQMSAYRLLLQAKLTSTDKRVIDCKQTLNTAVDELDKLLSARMRIMDEHAGAVWRGLSLDMQISLRSLLMQMSEIILSQDKAMMQLDTCGIADSFLSELRSHQQRLKMKITEFFETQIHSEQSALNLKQLDDMQHAVMQLMDDEGEQTKGKAWFVELMQRNRDYRQMLSKAMPALLEYQKKFSLYLESSQWKQSHPSRNVDDEIDEAKWRAIKTHASASYAFRTVQAMLKAKKEQSQEKKNVENAFRSADAFYADGNFKSALSGFLSGVNNMHAASYFKVGNMLMKGEGCDRDPGIARYYFWVAYGLEDVEMDGLPYYSAAIQADIDSAAFTVRQTPENADINKVIENALLDDDVLMKFIFKSQRCVMERFFRLGELLLTVMRVRSDKASGNRELLEGALYYFRWAYQYANDDCNRKNMVPDSFEPVEVSNAQQKFEKLKTDITWSLDSVRETKQLEHLHQLVDAFYERYSLKAELALTAPTPR